jgi:hypothetical protein
MLQLLMNIYVAISGTIILVAAVIGILANWYALFPPERPNSVALNQPEYPKPKAVEVRTYPPSAEVSIAPKEKEEPNLRQKNYVNSSSLHRPSNILLQNISGQVAIWELKGTNVIGANATNPSFRNYVEHT